MAMLDHTDNGTSSPVSNPDDVVTMTRAELQRIRDGEYIAGLTDGEACFDLIFQHKKKHPTGHARFLMTLRDDDTDILKFLINYFGCGYLKHKKYYKNPQMLFEVSKVDDLASIMVPHFDDYPLRAKKRRNFLIWKEGVLMMKDILHRKRIRKGGRSGGFSSTWRNDEVLRFGSLVEMLKEQRKYESSGLILIPEKSKPPASTVVQPGFSFIDDAAGPPP